MNLQNVLLTRQNEARLLDRTTCCTMPGSSSSGRSLNVVMNWEGGPLWDWNLDYHSMGRITEPRDQPGAAAKLANLVRMSTMIMIIVGFAIQLHNTTQPLLSLCWRADSRVHENEILVHWL